MIEQSNLPCAPTSEPQFYPILGNTVAAYASATTASSIITQCGKLFSAATKREFHPVLGDEHDEITHLVLGHVETILNRPSSHDHDIAGNAPHPGAQL